ncbi:MAG: PIG-L family deacetylase [Vicinamibacteria bacterium]
MSRGIRIALTAAGIAACALAGGPLASGQQAGSSYSGRGTGLDLMDVDVMFVGAHPDDDTGILATLARYLLDEGFKGAVVTLTGGEGGGNATGREAGPALGLIRQEEERRSLALVGVDAPQFLGLEDFHFTLSAEEVQQRWGDRFVCDLVRRVRLGRPEVIVTMWPGPGTHGQHQMAARAATLAYEKAGDPSYCPEQITREFLQPFVPAKLYYYPNDAQAAGVLRVPSQGVSRRMARRYADLRALAASHYRSQGFDQFSRLPAADVRPETFLLVRSRVPVGDPETHLLEGALLPVGRSPAGIRLEVEPAAYEVGLGADVAVAVRFRNGTASDLHGLSLTLDGGERLAVAPAPGPRFERVAPGERVEARFTLRPSGKAVANEPVRLLARYSAESEGAQVAGANAAWLEPVAAVQVAFRPTFDIAAYRDFARASRTEWVIPSLPTRLPLVVGRVGEVAATISSRSGEAARGELRLAAGNGVRLASPAPFDVKAGGSAQASLKVALGADALPEGRHSARLPVTLEAVAAGAASRDVAEIYALPALSIPRIPAAPAIDGDLADMRAFARGSIGPADLWWRRAPADAADLSADFALAYDAAFLYVGLHVRDENVVCNIAPDDVKAQLRSDAIGITVDPSGTSRDTSTTLQAAAFPCTTAGFGARGFRDADARPGLMEQTAPGMRIASRRTPDGYDVEAAIPWSAMPTQPRPGDEIGLNLVLYDGDQKDARVGANVSETGLAWAAFEWGGKQALPYLWPRVTLAR